MKQHSDPLSPLKAWGILIFLSLIWGTSYILIKKGLETFPFEQVASIRLGVSALLLLPYLAWQFRRINWSRWPLMIVVGLTGTGIPSFLFPIAQTQISSSAAGILNSLSPVFTLLIGALFFRSKVSWLKILGVITGLMGAVLLILSGKQGGAEGNFWYGGFVILATLCYGTSSNLVAYKLRDMNPVAISATSFVMVGLPALLFLFQTDFTERMQTQPESWTALGYIALLALMSTVMASIIFFQLVHRTNPVFASTVSYIVPAVAVMWGLFDGEHIGLFHVLAMVLILAGVYLSRH
ncbi:MAG: EamA family transporter [Saprospiraceae bacterium]|nr:EamA family transporter [Saprospiraceae bacterium]MDP4820048.1 EamA family transporter [Saprospiraceae bacterium]MDP4998497.1 EamA family transporter [Saprospiraceae bacterium]